VYVEEEERDVMVRAFFFCGSVGVNANLFSQMIVVTSGTQAMAYEAVFDC
jgi:hypothetical protein